MVRHASLFSQLVACFIVLGFMVWFIAIKPNGIPKVSVRGGILWPCSSVNWPKPKPSEKSATVYHAPWANSGIWD